MKKPIGEEEIIADQGKNIAGNTENSTEALFENNPTVEKTPEDSRIKSDIPRTGKQESIRYSKSKNMSKNRGYNEPPNTIPLKK